MHLSDAKLSSEEFGMNSWKGQYQVHYLFEMVILSSNMFSDLGLCSIINSYHLIFSNVEVHGI